MLKKNLAALHTAGLTAILTTDQRLPEEGEPIWRKEDRPKRDSKTGIVEAATMSGGTKIVAYNPVGYPPKVTAKPLAPRLDTLDGRTLYLVDCRFDDSDLFLKQIQAWFAENMPSVRTILKPLSSVYLRDDPGIWEEIKAKGHGAIVGVGH